MRSKVFAWSSCSKFAGALVCTELLRPFSDQIDRTVESVTVNYNFDQIAFADAADWPSSKRLWRDVPEACAGRHSAEACVGEHGNMLAEGEVLQSGGDLIDLLHSC